MESRRARIGDGTPGSADRVRRTPLRPANGYVLPIRRNPYGITFLGGSAGAEIIRQGGLKGFSGLTPELATNWGIGFDYTPERQFPHRPEYPGDLLHHQDQQRAASASATRTPAPSTIRIIGDFAFLVPTDYLDPTADGAAACTSNLLPTTCAPFQDAVQRSHQQSQSRHRSAGQDADHVDQRRRRLQQGLAEAGGHRLPGQLRLGLGRSRRVQRRDQRHLLSASERPNRLSTAAIVDDYPPDDQHRRTERSARHRDTAANALPRARGLGQRPVVSSPRSWIIRATTTIRRARRPM